MAGHDLRVVQVGLNTADVVGTQRLYAEAFGFANGGGTSVWGYTIGIQGLPEDSRATMSWLVGAQPFFQIEVFHHTRPAQRPLPADWTPSDHGWTRIGIEVADFDRCLEVWLAVASPLGDVVTVDGRRHVAFRDPYIGVVVECIEASDAAGVPAIRYVSRSVADADTSRKVYAALGLDIDPVAATTERQELWGLAGRPSTGFTVRSTPVSIEVVEYSGPAGRPQPADHRIGDQGVMNVAFGARVRAPVEKALRELGGLGYVPPRVVDRGGERVAGYIVDPEVELEFVSVPEEFDAAFGFVPDRPFLV